MFIRLSATAIRAEAAGEIKASVGFSGEEDLEVSSFSRLGTSCHIRERCHDFTYRPSPSPPQYSFQPSRKLQLFQRLPQELGRAQPSADVSGSALLLQGAITKSQDRSQELKGYFAPGTCLAIRFQYPTRKVSPKCTYLISDNEAGYTVNVKKFHA